MVTEQAEVRDLQEGNYLMMDDTPCRITSYSTAKPGKHGSAKARIEGRGVFDDRKRSLSQPVDAKIRVPIIERKQGQIVNRENGTVAQVMDLETYETFTMELPEDLGVENGDEIEYLEYEDQRKVVG